MEEDLVLQNLKHISAQQKSYQPPVNYHDLPAVFFTTLSKTKQERKYKGYHCCP